MNIISITSSAMSLGLESSTENIDKDQIISVFDTITEQANFMSETSNDFQSFFSPNKQNAPFRINDAIRKIENLLSHKVKSLDVKLIKNIENDFMVYGYVNEFAQVILNILNNALDALKKSDIENKTIIIDITGQEGKVVIKIKDNGGGIPKELLNGKIFEHFFTTKGKDGTGIGLSISKKIIKESFKGSLKAYNQDGGAVFEITLNKY